MILTAVSIINWQGICLTPNVVIEIKRFPQQCFECKNNKNCQRIRGGVYCARIYCNFLFDGRIEIQHKFWRKTFYLPIFHVY